MKKVKAVLYTTPEGIARFTEKAYLLYRKQEEKKAIEEIKKEPIEKTA